MTERTGNQASINRDSVLCTIRSAMRSGGCDLHMHTDHSDGSDTTRQLIDRVVKAGLRTFAITDHDTMAAIEEAKLYLQSRTWGNEEKPLLIPGVELSVSMNGREIHLLGYFNPEANDPLSEYLADQRLQRQARNRRMIQKLQKLGYDISVDAFMESGNESTGRVQAALMLKDKGYVKSIQDAFDRLLKEGRPAYVERKRPDIAEAVEAIHQAGGAVVLAHPALYGWCSGQPIVAPALLAALKELKAIGLDGVEAYHGEANLAEQQEIEAAGQALQLICTAGSDDHGFNKDRLLLYQQTDRWPKRPIMLVVGALDIKRKKDGQETYLLFKRKASGRHAGLWELPGGKVETGETPKDALVRELAEELDQAVTVGPLHTVLYHDYPGERVVLLVFHVSFHEPALKLLVHTDKIRVTCSQALQLPLLPADQTLFHAIMQQVHGSI